MPRKGIMFNSFVVENIEKEFYKDENRKKKELILIFRDYDFPTQFQFNGCISVGDEFYLKEPWNIVYISVDTETGYGDDMWEAKDKEYALNQLKIEDTELGYPSRYAIVTPECWNGYFKWHNKEDRGFRWLSAMKMTEDISRYYFECLKVHNVTMDTERTLYEFRVIKNR